MVRDRVYASLRSSELRRGLTCCMVALVVGVSAGCQLIMDDVESKDAGVDAGVDANEPDAEQDGNVTADADDFDAAETAPGDAHQEPDTAPEPDATSADADAAVAPVDTGLPDADPDACDGTGSRVFFRDQDQDGHGDPSLFMTACTAPPGYVSPGDDCHDDNDVVHPDQTEFFGEGYEILGSTLISFDYDCDEEERPGPGQNVANPDGCEGLLPCTGTGYIEAEQRDVPRTNDHCGSTTVLTCGLALICAGTQSSATPYVCN